MASRRTLALLALVLVALATGGPVLLEDACGNDCPPHCGYCTACLPFAVFATAPDLVTTLTGTALVVGPNASVSSASPRQLDHVPLRAVG